MLYADLIHESLRKVFDIELDFWVKRWIECFLKVLSVLVMLLDLSLKRHQPVTSSPRFAIYFQLFDLFLFINGLFKKLINLLVILDPLLLFELVNPNLIVSPSDRHRQFEQLECLIEYLSLVSIPSESIFTFTANTRVDLEIYFDCQLLLSAFLV